MRILTVNDMPFENAGDVRIDVRIEGIGSLLVNCTSEGVIIDAFGEDGEQIGTSSEMFDEIHERLRLKEARFAAAAQINAAIDELPQSRQAEIQAVLDELTDDMKGSERADLNNGAGVEQIEYLLTSHADVEQAVASLKNDLENNGVGLGH